MFKYFLIFNYQIKILLNIEIRIFLNFFKLNFLVFSKIFEIFQYLHLIFLLFNYLLLNILNVILFLSNNFHLFKTDFIKNLEIINKLRFLTFETWYIPDESISHFMREYCSHSYHHQNREKLRFDFRCAYYHHRIGNNSQMKPNSLSNNLSNFTISVEWSIFIRVDSAAIYSVLSCSVFYRIEECVIF